MRATVCWGSIRNRDCILYPGAGTVVKIRPAQTFYERIKVCYGATVSCDRERSIWTSRSERTPNRSTNISPGFNLSACSSILDRAVGRASRSTVMFRCRPMIVVLRLFRMFSGTSPALCTAITYPMCRDRPFRICSANIPVAASRKYRDSALKMSEASSMMISTP